MTLPRPRQLLDLAILLAVVFGVLYYVPRLFEAVERFTIEHAKETDWDPRYPLALKTLGLVPLLGSVLMLVPCISFMGAPARPAVRVVLGLLCITPITAAVVGTMYSPPDLTGALIGLGLLFSLGIWLFSLPVVVKNVDFIDVISRLSRGRGPSQ